MKTNTLFLKQQNRNKTDKDWTFQLGKDIQGDILSTHAKKNSSTLGHVSRQEQQILDRQHPSVFIHPADCLRISSEGIKLLVVRWFDVRSENIITASEAKTQRVAG